MALKPVPRRHRALTDVAPDVRHVAKYDRMLADSNPVSNSLVAVDVPNMVVPMEAFDIWTFRFSVSWISTQIAGIRFSFAALTGLVGRWGFAGAYVDQALVTRMNSAALGGDAVGFYLGAHNPGGGGAWLVIEGIAINGANAGDLRLRFAQDVAEVSATRVLLHSHFEAMQW